MSEPTRMSALRRFWPLAALAGIAAAALALDLHKLISFEALREHRAALTGFVAARQAEAMVLYLGLYAGVVAVSLPGALVLTVAGGFLFGAILGGALAVVAATIGATLVFLVARTALGGALRARAGGALARMREGFKENAFSYLLALRLAPVFPFVLVNVAPAALGVPLRTYVAATALGIVPGTFVYATVGAGLGSVFDRGEAFSAAGVLTPQVVAGFVGLSLLAAAPALVRRFRRSKAPHRP